MLQVVTTNHIVRIGLYANIYVEISFAILIFLIVQDQTLGEGMASGFRGEYMTPNVILREK